MRENRDKTQKQMAKLWDDEATQQNISYACKKLGITQKKTYGYQERDEEKRGKFREKLEKIANNRKIYVDKAGFYNREDYPYGSSLKGERCQALRSGKRTERVSWLAALKSGKIFASLSFQGSCNKNLFETCLKDCLLPKLEQGDIIIIDNATFHKGEYIREIIESAGFEIWYLPPYLPDAE